MYARVGYDPVKDFAAVVRVAHNPLLVAVHPSMPVRSINDLTALAKARPGQINFASGGIGSSPHMTLAEQFAAFLRDENARWGKLIRDLNLRAE